MSSHSSTVAGTFCCGARGGRGCGGGCLRCDGRFASRGGRRGRCCPSPSAGGPLPLPASTAVGLRRTGVYFVASAVRPPALSADRNQTPSVQLARASRCETLAAETCAGEQRWQRYTVGSQSAVRVRAPVVAVCILVINMRAQELRGRGVGQGVGRTRRYSVRVAAKGSCRACTNGARRRDQLHRQRREKGTIQVRSESCAGKCAAMEQRGVMCVICWTRGRTNRRNLNNRQ